MREHDEPIGAPKVIIPTRERRRGGRWANRDTEYFGMGLVPLIFLIMSFFVVPHAVRLDQHLAATGIPATAIVTDTVWVKWGPDIVNIRFRTATGAPVKTQISAPDTPWGGSKDGARIPILYLPSEPTTARYATWKATWNALIFPVAPAVIFGIFFLALTYEKYGARRRSRES